MAYIMAFYHYMYCPCQCNFSTIGNILCKEEKWIEKQGKSKSVRKKSTTNTCMEFNLLSYIFKKSVIKVDHGHV